MDEQDLKFFRTSFDRLELLLERIAIAIEKKKAPIRAPSVDHGASKIAAIWNEWKATSFACVNGLSSGSNRNKNASARWKEKPEEAYWIRVIQKVNDSKFCNGDNDRGWVADFEFLVRPDNHYRILEGKYDRCHVSFKNEAPAPKIVIDGYLDDGTPVIRKV